MSGTARIGSLSADLPSLQEPPADDERPGGRNGGASVAPLAEKDELTPTIPAIQSQDDIEKKSSVSAGEPRPARSGRLRGALFAALPIALAAGGYWYVAGGQVMSTEDAYVSADQVGVSTDVSGVVKRIHVVENQRVDAGQMLFRLDPLQAQIALDNARANLAQTALLIESMKLDYQRMLSDVAAQQAQVDLDQATYDRNAALANSGAVAKSAYDQARFTLQAGKSKLESLRQQAQVQLARLNGDLDQPTELHPQYLQAKAQVDEAQRQLDHTIVQAPFAGVVTQVSSIAVGKYLPASTTAFYLVGADHAWVDAQPKETELTYVRPGQPVTVTVNTYPGAEWRGSVDSVSPAAAQQFSLLPAQNSSGNWVKVVQRIPMRVRVDASDSALPPLRSGMSVIVNVDTGRPCGLPQFLTDMLSRLGWRSET